MADTEAKRKAIVDFEEATAQKDPGVERGPGSNLMNLLLYSAAQVEALCRIAKEVLFVYIFITIPILSSTFKYRSISKYI